MPLYFFALFIFLLIQQNSKSDELDLAPKCHSFDNEIMRSILVNQIRQNPNLKYNDKELQIQTIKKGESIVRMEMSHSYLSPSGKFRIHYEIEGESAVDITDNNNNSIPDYIDSCAYFFDIAYDIQVNQMGYNPPPPDAGAGGGNEYDVYVLDLGNSWGGYGYCDAESELLPPTKFPRFSSYIVIDNDYSPKDSSISGNRKIRSYYTTGYDALKITAAHELHHAVQYTYGLVNPSVPSIYELTSSWMEYRIYPHIKDYYQFLPQLFNGFRRYPFSIIDSDNGYRWSIFGQYMHKSFGDDLMLNVWQLIGDGNDAFLSLNKAYINKGTTLNDEWCKFKEWIYYTGSRTIPDKYFNDAHDFPEIKFYSDTSFLPTFVADTGSLLPFELRGIRKIFSPIGERSADTSYIIITNTDFESLRYIRKISQNYEIKYSSEFFIGSIPIEGTDYFISVFAPENFFCYEHYVYPGINTCTVDYPYPQPFDFGIEKQLFLPVKAQILLYEMVELVLYNIELIPLYSKQHQVIYHNGCRVVMIDDLSKIKSGTYIYQIKHKSADTWGKLLIRRKI